MKNHNLTIIFYQPNGCQTCRCCVVDTWDSAFKVEFPKTLDEARTFIDDPKWIDCSYCILVNGMGDNVDNEFFLVNQELFEEIDKIYGDHKRKLCL